MILRNTNVTLYRMRLRKEMIYRMIYVRAWAKYLDIHSQALRNLRIQIEKLDRLCEKDEFDYMFHRTPAKRIESLKHAQRIIDKKDSKIIPQYKVVLSHIEKVLRDLATHKGEGTLTKAELRGRLHKFVSETESYARKHVAQKKKKIQKKKKSKKKKKNLMLDSQAFAYKIANLSPLQPSE